MLSPSISPTPPLPALPAPAPSDALTVQLVDSRRGIDQVRADWSELRRAGAVTSPNSDPDRFLATLDALGASAKPYIAVFRRAGRCQAILVARISGSRTRHRLGYWSIPGPRLRLLEVVYDGLLTSGSPHAVREMLEHLGALRDSRVVDAIQFNHLKSGGAAEAEVLRFGGIRTADDPHWIVDVKRGSFEDSLAHHGGEFRKKLRRYERKAAERFDGRLTLRTIKDPSQVGDFIRVMDAIASRSYKSRIPVSNAGARVWETLLASEASAGRLRCYVLEGSGQPVAYQVGTIYGTTYHCEGRGYDPRFRDLSPGTVLFTMTLRDLCTLDIDQMDFGFGDAEHKGNFGTRSWRESSIRIRGLGWRSRADAMLARAVASASSLGRRTLRGAGLLKRVKQWSRRWLLASSGKAENRA